LSFPNPVLIMWQNFRRTKQIYIYIFCQLAGCELWRKGFNFSIINNDIFFAFFLINFFEGYVK
jgi:hypothetical protein